jgi:hypothetical protein
VYKVLSEESWWRHPAASIRGSQSKNPIKKTFCPLVNKEVEQQFLERDVTL